MKKISNNNLLLKKLIFNNKAIFKRNYSFNKILHSSNDSLNENTNIIDIAEKASEILPHQGILENFVHHNPLQIMEHMEFKKAIEHSHEIESYLSPGARMFNLLGVDPRERVNEAIVDVCSPFLDRGSAKWQYKRRIRGFLYYFASLENLGFISWREHARKVSKRIITILDENQMTPETLSENIIRENLLFFGIPEEEFTSCIQSISLDLRGWAGMFKRMETYPLEAPNNTPVRFIEFIAVKTILDRASMEFMALKSGNWDGNIETFGNWLMKTPLNKIIHDKDTVHMHPSSLAYINQNTERREKLESEFEKILLKTLGKKEIVQDKTTRPDFQIYTCIDDRECSFRRHIESTKTTNIETYGVAGFFGVPIRYQPLDGRDQMILAPEGIRPGAILTEHPNIYDQPRQKWYERKLRFMTRIAWIGEKLSFSPLGSIFLTLLFPLSLARLWLMGFSPELKLKIKTLTQEIILKKPLRSDFQPPYNASQAAEILAKTFKDIGTQDRFSPIVLVLGHCSTSLNNPFSAAYNCGACGGREGGPNARLFARMANDFTVRKRLLKDHHITIPNDTMFIGAMHNTTSDTIQYYDMETIPRYFIEKFSEVQRIVEEALGKNALERCDRFFLADKVKTPQEALKHVLIRSNDLAEVRPELNHATNAAVIIGRREITRDKFLDRRVFLPSYDPFNDDENGTNLEHVLAPALTVCSGINLEYLFSTVDVENHGAGSKAPLNIVGNIGVLQGISGDLRTGLPSQMTEFHQPVRSLFVVESGVGRVEAVLKRRRDLDNLVKNGWVNLIIRDPHSLQYFKLSNNQYQPLSSIEKEIEEWEEKNKEEEMKKKKEGNMKIMMNMRDRNEKENENNMFVKEFSPQKKHAQKIARREELIHKLSIGGLVMSWVVPVFLFSSHSMNPIGPLIALGATSIALPVVAFARRYLHGEFIFERFSLLSTALVLGFNLVATAPNLAIAMGGWSLIGYASTFLIGTYNERITVRNNATFAFASYQISDFAMLIAVAFSPGWGGARDMLGFHSLGENSTEAHANAMAHITSSSIHHNQLMHHNQMMSNGMNPNQMMHHNQMMSNGMVSNAHDMGVHGMMNVNPGNMMNGMNGGMMNGNVGSNVIAVGSNNVHDMGIHAMNAHAMGAHDLMGIHAVGMQNAHDFGVQFISVVESHPLVAGGLLVSALLKSSQFPLTSLFARSMEGPTPASALGYAGLSAHVGVVLLTSTLPLWYEYTYARAAIGLVGMVTVVDASLRAKIIADRKGAIANATSATLGVIYIVLSLGYPNLALFFSFGHAAYRIIQILRAPSSIGDFQRLKKDLKGAALPKVVPTWLFKLAWSVRRFTKDYNPIYYYNEATRYLLKPTPWNLNKFNQWVLTTVGLVLSGFPFTPYSHMLEHKLMELLHTHPILAGLLMLGHLVVSVSLIKVVFTKVLTSRRFLKEIIKK